MPDTVFYGVVTFLLVLGPLVILHEFGHLLTARKFGVKTLEFGFGYPPRAGGLWSGKTPVKVDSRTAFEIEMTVLSSELAAIPATDEGDTANTGVVLTDAPESAHRQIETADGEFVTVDQRSIIGKTATIRTVRDDDGNQVAVSVRTRAKGDDSEASEGAEIVTGKIKSFDGDTIVMADMLWSFNWLPLGGFVRMVGEESGQSVGSLGSKPRWQRIVVMAAGAVVNAIIPFILLPLVLMWPSDKVLSDVTVATVFPGSPADEAGIRPGDRIVSVDGRSVDNISELQQAVTVRLGAESVWEIESGIPNIFARPAEGQYQYSGETEKVTIVPRWKPPNREVVETVTDPETQMALSQARIYQAATGTNDTLSVVVEPTDTLYQISVADAAELDPPAALGDTLKVVFGAENAGEEISLADARAHDHGLGVITHIQEGATGIQISEEQRRIEKVGLNPLKAFPTGWRQTIDTLVITRNAFTTAIIGSTNPQFDGPSTVGPVGIGQLTGEVATADAGLDVKIVTLATLAATLSLSLAILNILPIPALDGGRIFFVFVEILRRGKRISPEREGLVHLVGFAMLIGLIIVISIQDVSRIIRGESIIG